MSSARTTAVWLALLALGTQGCVEVVVVRPDSGASNDGGREDGGVSDDSGDGAEADGGSADGGGSDEDAIVTGRPAEGEWIDVSANLAGMQVECGTVTTIAASPSENRLLVGLSGRGVYSSTDGGGSWVRLGMGAGSVAMGARVSQFVFDPEHVDTYYVSGIYAAPGVVKTTDNGTTFKALGDVWHNDSVSVDFRDPQRQTLLAGTHEQSRVLWRSADGGATWQNIGAVLPTDAGWSLFPLVIDARTYLLGTPGSGIYRSTNSGTAWTNVSKVGGGAVPLRASDDSIYWPSADGALVRSTDDGQSWEQVTPANILYPVALVELPDGRIAGRGPEGVLVSGDQGAHWERVAPREPFEDPLRAFALAYSLDELAFFVAQSSCMGSVPAKSVVRFDWDWE